MTSLLESFIYKPPSGKATRKIVPWGLLEKAASVPPWASTIERQMARPIPVPPVFVVKAPVGVSQRC
jgi:hypothetical protein